MQQPKDHHAPILFYTRPTMFDETRFAHRHSVVYSDGEMMRFDAAVESATCRAPHVLGSVLAEYMQDVSYLEPSLHHEAVAVTL